MRLSIFLLSILLFISNTKAQIYSDYLGAGHKVGITVTSSSNHNNTNDGEHSINGTGYFLDEYGASRFLGQATLGADYETIQSLTQSGVNAWIDQQITMSGSSYLDLSDNITAEIIAEKEALGQSIQDAKSSYENPFWHKLITENDLLRQRVTLALSEILVASNVADDLKNTATMNAYLDVLHQNAFGNYKDLLYDITLNPAMALYLTYYRNQPTDEANNIHPDENYAREIMQLFTIGIHELNLDSSPKLDASGAPIETYTINDVKELAKIFTGLYPSDWNYRDYPDSNGALPLDGQTYIYDNAIPLTMHEAFHEQGEKHFLNHTILAGNTGLQDIEQAIQVIFNHPNVGPFIGQKLIQFLVKSNPSPEYIKRVAMTFNNDGHGVRGNLEAVIKAIFTDPEARDCEWLDDPTTGKMREVMIRNMHILRAFNAYNQSGKYWKVDLNDYRDLIQTPMTSPSVFNFFQPSFSPYGVIRDNGLVAPEFQVVTDNTIINNINIAEDKIINEHFLMQIQTRDPNHTAYENHPIDKVRLNLTDEENIYNSGGSAALVERLNLILCHGQLSQAAKNIIVDALNEYQAEGFSTYEIVRKAVFFIFISPDYVIMK